MGGYGAPGERVGRAVAPKGAHGALGGLSRTGMRREPRGPYSTWEFGGRWTVPSSRSSRPSIIASTTKR